MEPSQISITDYFDFLDADDIRIRGTRVGIETVLDDYLNAHSPEEIAVRYPTLTLEQVYASITFYLSRKSDLDAYLAQWRRCAENSWKDQSANPTPAVRRLMELKKQRKSA